MLEINYLDLLIILILAAAIEKAGHSIDKKFINVTGGNVKRLGKYNAIIRLHRDVAVDFPFEIIAAK